MVSYGRSGVDGFEHERAGRHTVVTWLLLALVPVLGVFGIREGWSVTHLLVEIVLPLVGLWAVARSARRYRVAAGAGGLGLMYASAVLVHATGGVTEAHFAFFVAFGLVALYRDWWVFFTAAAFAVGHHVVLAFVGEGLFSQPYQQDAPLLWAAIHVGFVTLVTAVTAVGMYDVARSVAGRARAEADLAHAEERRGTALRLHDEVVQALATANYARDLGEEEVSAHAMSQALDASRELVGELIGDGPLDPALLEREGAALHDGTGA